MMHLMALIATPRNTPTPFYTSSLISSLCEYQVRKTAPMAACAPLKKHIQHSTRRCDWVIVVLFELHRFHGCQNHKNLDQFSGFRNRTRTISISMKMIKIEMLTSCQKTFGPSTGGGFNSLTPLFRRPAQDQLDVGRFSCGLEMWILSFSISAFRYKFYFYFFS